MNAKSNQGGAENPAATFTQEQLTAAREEGRQIGLAEGRQAGAEAERTRVKAILSHPEAADRAELAQHLAFETDTPAETATALLAKAPKAQSGGRLAEAMARVGTPAVPGQEVTTDAPAPKPALDAFEIYRRMNAGQTPVAGK